MSIDVRTCTSVDELRRALDAISHYFGNTMSEEDAESFSGWIDLERMHAAFEGERIVGAAGAFTYEMSVPGGGSVPAGGVTAVGVLPTHRRRGVLSSMMRAQIDDSRARGDAAMFLWASEATIYGRFGYGVSALAGEMKLAKERTAFAAPFDPRGVVRLLELDEAARVFPPLYEQVFAQRPGMCSRSDVWWRTRRLRTGPRTPAPKNLALLELDGTPAGYAIYTVKQDWSGGVPAATVSVQEAIAPTPEATRELWRWLLDFDLASEFQASLLPVDHPLFLLLAEPRRMAFRLGDSLWVRLLDIPAAFAARSLSGGELVVDVTDSFVPENAGRWRIAAGGAERTDVEAEIALDVSGLGSVYLGGFGFRQLVEASRATELVPGAVERADAMFRTGAAPWCPEIF